MSRIITATDRYIFRLVMVPMLSVFVLAASLLMLDKMLRLMEFVVMVLKRFFRMDLEQATRVMLHVHQKGVGVCGVYPYEVAETKVNQVMDCARENQHPLQCTLEKA